MLTKLVNWWLTPSTSLWLWGCYGCREETSHMRVWSLISRKVRVSCTQGHQPGTSACFEVGNSELHITLALVEVAVCVSVILPMLSHTISSVTPCRLDIVTYVLKVRDFWSGGELALSRHVWSHGLGCQIPTRAPFRVLAGALLNQFPTNVLGKAAKDGKTAQGPGSMWES